MLVGVCTPWFSDTCHNLLVQQQSGQAAQLQARHPAKSCKPKAQLLPILPGHLLPAEHMDSIRCCQRIVWQHTRKCCPHQCGPRKSPLPSVNGGWVGTATMGRMEGSWVLLLLQHPGHRSLPVPICKVGFGGGQQWLHCGEACRHSLEQGQHLRGCMDGWGHNRAFSSLSTGTQCRAGGRNPGVLRFWARGGWQAHTFCD